MCPKLICRVLDLVHRQLKVLKDKISELSKTNYELEREVRFFDQRIGLLINHKKAVEVSYVYHCISAIRRKFTCRSITIVAHLFSLFL